MSLSQQLKQINEKSASLALDRKSRAKLHSKSLIFGPKVAATQDYDYLHLIGVAGLTELCTMDSRFSKFQQTLFADSTVTFDRNVQTKEIEENLNASITAFLNLVSPYYSLSPAVRAVEWLVRRFYINIHNAENLILTCLPHYQLQIFARVMNVIPKSLWPPIFNWLSGYRDMTNNPPSTSILKAFRNDYQLVKLYSEYLIEQLQAKTVYKEQLVFYLTNMIQLLASYSNDSDKLNGTYLPLILEVVGKLLLPQGTSNLDHDLKIAAYTLISVLVTMTPLADNVHISMARAIVQAPGAFESDLMRQSLIVLVQVFQHYSGNDFHFDFLNDIPENVLFDESLIKSLTNENFDLNKYIYAAIASIENTQILALSRYFKITSANEQVASGIITQLIIRLNEQPDSEARSTIVSAFEVMLFDAKEQLVTYLASREEPMSISDLEMLLLTTLSFGDVEEVSHIQNEGEVADIESEKAEAVNLDAIKSNTKNFLLLDDDGFYELSKYLVSYLSNLKASSYASKISKFNSRILDTPEASVTFTLRCAFTSSIPLKVRSSCLIDLKRKLKDLGSNDDTKLYLLVPILVLGLFDDHEIIRLGTSECLSVVSSCTSKSKKPKVFLESEIYGKVPAQDKVIISPKDGDILMDQLAKSDILQKEVIMDKSRLSSILFESLFELQTPKKFGLLCKTFFLGQWANVSLAVVFKSLAFKLVSARNEKKACSARGSFFKNDVSHFLESITRWSKLAELDKLDFEKDILIPLVGLVGGRDNISSTYSELSESTETNWLLKAVDSSNSSLLQNAAKDRIIANFGFIQPENKFKIITKFIDLQVSDQTLGFDAQEALQAMPLDFSSSLSLLNNYQLVSQIPEQKLPKRRRRSSNSSKQNMAHEELVSIASVHLKKLTIVLDLLELNLRKSLKEVKPELLLSFFRTLTDLEYLGHDGDMPVLYTQEVLATCMLLSVRHIKAQAERESGGISIDSNSVRADLIVNTIRSSSSPQIQNRLLLVVAELASLAPEIVLHSVMPIFTFMGAHTIRQDDEFSSFALQDTIAKVVPALANSGASSFSNEIEFLLTSFVTAFQHIPRHRRVKLFTTLSLTLGTENSVHTILFLLGVQYSLLIAKGKHGDCTSLLEFAQDYMKQFKAPEQLSSIYQYMELWQLVPTKSLDPESDEYKNLNSRPIFGSSILSLSASEVSDMKAVLISFVDSLLHAEDNTVGYLQLKASQILLDSGVAEADKALIVDGCQNITSSLLGYLDDFSHHSKLTKISKNLFQLLNDVLSLLPLSSFLDSIINVLNKPDGKEKIAINFARLAANKIEDELNSSSLDETVQLSMLEHLIPALMTGIKSNTNVEIKQAYVDILSQAISKLGSSSSCFKDAKNISQLNTCLTTLTSDVGLRSQNPECIISSINCLSVIINIMGVKAIGFFPKIFEPALDVWKNTKANEDDELSMVQTTVLLLFAQLSKKLPAFVTSRLEDIFKCAFGSTLIEINIRSSILTTIVDHVDAAHLLRSLCNVWPEISKNDDAEVIGLYLAVMEKIIDKLEKKAAISQATVFIKWMIRAFEFRLEVSESSEQDFDSNTIHRLEASFHSSGLKYVMKLNDKTFRPLFASLVRWTVSGEGSNNKVDQVDRYVAFFRFFNKLQEQLKSIITSYYSYLIEPVSNLLSTFDDNAKNVNLKRLVLNSLTSSFKYDQDDSWSQQLRFDAICDPLLEQIPGIEDSIGKYLVKCISAFVVNVSSEEHNEKLVHGLIKYISNENSTTTTHTKTWAIRILKSIFQTMGDQWLPYLPTLIPYIAELLEDDDEEVELEVRRGLVKVIENVLGEPLDRYLS